MLSQAQNIFHRMLNISYPRLRGPVSSNLNYHLISALISLLQKSFKPTLGAVG